EPGTLHLAGERVNSKAVARHSGDLAAIAEALAAHATIALHACSAAAGAAGRRLVAELSAALGATVVASRGPVGPARLGGRWSAAARTLFVPSALAAYPGLLDNATLTGGNDTPALTDG